MKFLSTGYENLDRVLGGGWPLGGSVLVKGLAHAGKSSLVRATLGRLPVDVTSLLVLHEEPLFTAIESLRRLAPDAHARLSGAPGPGDCIVRDKATIADWHKKPRIAVFDDLLPILSTKQQVCRWAHLESDRAIARRHAFIFILQSFKTSGNTLGSKTLEHEMDTVLQVEKDGNGFVVINTKSRVGVRYLSKAHFSFTSEGALRALSDVSMAGSFERRLP